MDGTDRESYSDVILILYGDIVAWFVHKQPGLTVPSIDADYVAISGERKGDLALHCYVHELCRLPF